MDVEPAGLTGVNRAPRFGSRDGGRNLISSGDPQDVHVRRSAMNASLTDKDFEVIRGAANIANAIRNELVNRGRRHEEIALEWLPDPRFGSIPEAPELKAEVEATGSVQQMFSREELEVSSEQLVRDSVVAKIDLVVEALQAGLP